MPGYVQLSWKTWPDVVALLGEHLDDNIDGTGMAHTTHRFRDPCGEAAPYLSLRMRAATDTGFIDFAHGAHLGPDTAPGTYRQHTFDHPGRSVQRFKLTKISSNDTDFLTFEASGSVFGRAASDLARTPQPGDELFLETVQASIVVGLRDKDGWLFRQSDQQIEDQFAEQSAKWEQKRRDTLEECRGRWQEIEDGLPDWLQARLARFRTAGGEAFELDGWGYELTICQLAAMYLADDTDAIRELDGAAGCSGNQHSCAKALAEIHRRGDSIDRVPAGLSPLTGSPDYAPKKD